jgi:hypothetical protein
MLPHTDQDYEKLLAEILQKQTHILGLEVTLLQARHVKGLAVGHDGKLISVNGNHQEITQQLIEQLRELSEPLVDKIIQPILTYYPHLTVYAHKQSASQQIAVNPNQQSEGTKLNAEIL